MIQLRCYEPAGLVLSLSENDLSRHVLALGATGSGKTTAIINPLLRQLIGRPAAGGKHCGLLVLDPKGDDTPNKIKEYASEAGRERDVIVLSSSSPSYYDFFALQRLDQVEELARRVLYGSAGMSPWDSYWTEGRFGLIQTALTLMLAGGKPSGFDGAIEFLRAFVYDRNSPHVVSRIEFINKLLRVEGLKPITRRRLELAVVDAQNWSKLDDRTREIHKSTVGNALRAVLSPASRDFFDAARGSRFDPHDVLQGKILVSSLNAIRHPQLAALLFKTLKRDFYDAILKRPMLRPGRDRVCALVLDELALAVTGDDLDALASIRSHGGVVVSAAQGLNGLDAVIGRMGREALLNNFGSYFFFSARENALDEFAMLSMGLQAPEEDHRPGDSRAFIPVADLSQEWQPRPVCPPGSLARLGQHHCYAKLAGGTITKNPVWLEPIFHSFVAAPSPSPPDDLADAVIKLNSQLDETKMLSASPPLLLNYMHQRGHRLLTTPALVAAAWQLCVPSLSRIALLRATTHRYRISGLNLLPSCWLVGLLRWLDTNPNLSTTIVEVSHHGGILWLRLDPSCAQWGDGPLALPARVNLWIYPSLWRPLSRGHRVRLLCERPDLRDELLSVPQLALSASTDAAAQCEEDE